MPATFSDFATACRTETAFDVLAIAKQLIAAGKDVIELEIGDSPFPTARSAAKAGLTAIQNDRCHYGPSNGLLEFRQAAADYMRREYAIDVGPDHIVAGPGAKTFQQLFCEAFLNPGDGVLVFSPYFPTYPPNIHRRNARMVLSVLRQENGFRPNLEDVRRFLTEDASPKAIFLNTPHNPTGGVATREDVAGLADLIRGAQTVLFSDEPYDQMAWRGEHHPPIAEPEMLDQAVSVYTFSKSYSMSGWRLGFSVSSPRIAEKLALLTNTSLSCVPPFTQLAGAAALLHDHDERDERMQEFQRRVERLAERLDQLDGVRCLTPGGSFYVFPSIAGICNRLQITSHGFALYLLEAADDEVGVACLGGECFGEAGAGFLRLSTAEPEDRLLRAVEFLDVAKDNQPRVDAFLAANPQHRLSSPYDTPN